MNTERNLTGLDSLEGIPTTRKLQSPISGERLDERAVRIVAGIVVLLLAGYMLADWFWAPSFLALDFLLRGVLSRKWSPLGILARGIVKRLGNRGQKWINAGPKIFAARIGIAFSALLLLLQGAGYGNSYANHVVVILFGVAAFLEVAFAFCLGCHIYTFIQRLKPRNHLGEGI